MKKIYIILFCFCCTMLFAQQRQCYLTSIDSINTSLNEFNTVLNPDETIMSYSSSKELKHGDWNEHVLFATGEGRNWQPSGQVLAINKKATHIDIVGWVNNDTVFVYDGRKKGIIGIYSNNNGKWKKCGKIKLCSSKIKKSCMNSSATSIYFSTEKRGGKGKQDIYVSHLGSDGKWSKPVILSDSINTVGNEIAPALVGDSVLFFASDGHSDGLGGYDIYYSRIVNGEWSKAVNVGEPINSSSDDVFYYKAKTERNAFISSNREGGKGGLDIYAISYILDKHYADNLPPVLSAITDKLLSNINIQAASHLDSTKITLLSGIIMGDDSIPLQAEVALSDNGLMQVIATQKAEESGAYKVILPGGANYGIAVSYPGYLFHSENFDLPEQNEYKEINKNIVLKKIAIGKNVALRNLFFEVDKSTLSDESIVELANVIRLLNENPTLHIEIEGHTDNTGSKSHNQKLSEARAKAVVDYLVEHGIDAKRLTSKGYGFSKPVATNKTPEGRAENRRTELLVTKI